jgi:bacteriocin-like protein
MQTAATFSQPNFHVGSAMTGRDSAQKIRVLSDDEMAQVSGGLGVPGAAAGAVYGAVTYGIATAYSGTGTWGGLIASVAGGALVGATGGALSAGAAIWGFNATVIASTASGITSLPSASTGGGGQSCTRANSGGGAVGFIWIMADLSQC